MVALCYCYVGTEVFFARHIFFIINDVIPIFNLCKFSSLENHKNFRTVYVIIIFVGCTKLVVILRMYEKVAKTPKIGLIFVKKNFGPIFLNLWKPHFFYGSVWPFTLSFTSMRFKKDVHWFQRQRFQPITSRFTNTC